LEVEMAKKRGFLAELQHQSQVAAKRREQQARATARAHNAAQREAERAWAQHTRLVASLAKASAAEQKAAEREMKRLHEEAMAAEVEAKNAELAAVYEEIDSILAATLAVDDFVDLEQLRTAAQHPPFESENSRPGLPPPPLQPPPQPVYTPPPDEPSKLGGVFGARKKWLEAEAHAKAAFAAAHQTWSAEVAQLPVRQQQLQEQFQRSDAERLQRFAADKARYDAECAARDREAAEANARLDALVQGLAYGVEEAVQEYVSIVLSNSVYPESFPVEHDFEFSSALKELTLTALVPPPGAIPSIREYKYVKAKDEITSTALPQKDAKERYRSAITQVAVRSIHEVFESDRAGRIQTINLTVATETIDPATGRPKRTPLVAAAADRAAFMSFDLANVVPAATLQHLGAQISKSPFDLAPVDTTKGVRGR
jgi:restriction system protein